MNKRNRQRKRARRAAFRDSKPVILVVAEGKVTEKEYIEGFTKFCQNPRVRIHVHGGVGVPRTIVEYAKDQKSEAHDRARQEGDDNLSFDEVWCVFDIDQHPNVADAIQMASANQLQLAISNPCFELWLWLHFAPQPGMQHRHKLQKMLKRHLPNYDKHLDFSQLAEGYEDAVTRAEQLEAIAEKDNDQGRNPTTGVWRLTQSICRVDVPDVDNAG